MTDLTGKIIVQVIPELETGGAERTTLEIAQALIAVGAKAIVVSAGGRLVPALTALGATHIELPVHSKNPLFIHQNAKALTTLGRDHKIDLIHVRSRAPAWSARTAARRLGIPFITTYHGIYTAKNALKRSYNAVMASGDVVIANSDYTRATVLAEHAPRPLSDPSRLITIHRGADLDIFSPEKVTPARAAALKTAWTGPDERADSLKILLPGRLTSWKGQEILLEAIRMLQATRQGVNLRLILCGSAQGRDTYEAALRHKIEVDKTGHLVAIMGHCDDMAAAYDWADLVISASTRPEAFGRVAIEAQAMATPVIATNHGGACETVIDGQTGYLVAPGEAEDMAASIGRFIDLSPDQRAIMAKAARENAVTRFSIDRMTGATLAVYAGAIREKTKTVKKDQA